MSDVQVQPMLYPGDIFLTRGTNLMSRLIRRFTRNHGESRTMVNHVGLVVSHGGTASSEIVEALTTVRRRRFSVYRNKPRHDVAVYRPTNLTTLESLHVSEHADNYVGRKYGYIKIVAHFLDWCLAGRYFFRRFAFMDNYPICSWVVAQAFAKEGYTFGVDPGAASPDDIWDFVTNNPDKYDCIYELGRLP